MNKKISILGCGWLGKPLGQNLLKKGYSVAGSTTTESKLEQLENIGINAFLITLNPYIAGENKRDFFDADVLIASIPPKRKSGGDVNYFQQMEEVVKECLQSGIKKVVFISSTSVYPDLNREVTEEDPVVDEKESVLVKAEKLFQSTPDLKTTVVRFAGLVGEQRHPGRFLAGKVGVGGPNSPVNLIHLTDCISIITRIIETDCFGEIFNACADNHPTKKEFYSRASEILSLPSPVFVEEEENSFKIISSEKLKTKLGIKFTYPDPFLMV